MSLASKLEGSPATAAASRHVRPHVRSPHYRIVRGRRVAVRSAIVNGAAAWSRRDVLQMALARAQATFALRATQLEAAESTSVAALDLIELALIKEKLMEAADKVIAHAIDDYHRLSGDECAGLAMARVRVAIARAAGAPQQEQAQLEQALIDLEDDLLAASLGRLAGDLFHAVGERLEESSEIANLRFRLAYLRALEQRQRDLPAQCA